MQQLPVGTVTFAFTDIFEDRIEAYVQGHLERAFSGEQVRVPARLAFGGAAIGLGVLFMVALVIVAIGLLIKVAFF